MTGKVDETLDKIPTLKVNLDDIIDFKGKCIDQLAIDIITESIDYALKTSVRRLESVAKINPTIRDNATETILPAIKTLRNLIQQAPACSVSALNTAPIKTPPPRPVIKKTETPVKKSEQTKKTVKVPPKKATETIPVDLGRVFEIDYDGVKKKYQLVAKQAMKNPKQVPSDPNVEKLSEESPLAKMIIGKKSGETADLIIEGKTYTATIKDVREAPDMILLEPPKED
jgi:transcription elongation GreA/GreB family factor